MATTPTPQDPGAFPEPRWVPTTPLDDPLTSDEAFDPPPPRPPLLGGHDRATRVPTTLADRYEIIRELGRGGMGVVQLARDRRLKRLVALKFLLRGPGPLAPPDSRFRAEAEAVARLQHPNIVRIYEVEVADGQACLVLEYVGGGSLALRLAREPLVPRAAAALLADLADAVQYAHEHGVVHRDLKPANVLLQTDQNQSAIPKIADFGLAKRSDPAAENSSDAAGPEAAGGADGSATRTGMLLGSPSYMAPEQAAGRPDLVGPSADVYALGATLYECLTGRPPFRAASAAETLELVRSREPVSVRQLQPRVPRDLETIALKCLRKEPAGRYAGAADLAEDLRRYLRGEPVRARPVGPFARLAMAARRRPAVAALVALVALAAIGGPQG